YDAASGIGGEVGEVAHLANHAGADDSDAGRQRGEACCEAKRFRSTRKWFGIPHAEMNAGFELVSRTSASVSRRPIAAKICSSDSSRAAKSSIALGSS